MLTETTMRVILVSFPSGGGLGACSLDCRWLLGLLSLGEFEGNVGVFRAAMSLDQSPLARLARVGGQYATAASTVARVGWLLCEVVGRRAHTGWLLQ